MWSKPEEECIYSEVSRRSPVTLARAIQVKLLPAHSFTHATLQNHITHTYYMQALLKAHVTKYSVNDYDKCQAQDLVMVLNFVQLQKYMESIYWIHQGSNS